MAGIYIHVPFCRQACHYCNFHFSTSLRYKDDLIKALVKEIQVKKNYLGQEEVETIYFGGGTPSLLNVEDVRLLIAAIKGHYAIISDAEITLEANPDDINAEKLADWKDAGINRLSIGIQSFFEEDLQWMNRAHTAEQAISNLQLAIKHFNNITIDLIYGSPGLSNEKWKQNVDTALSLGIPHLSCYALTVEEKTPLDKLIRQKKSSPVDADKQAEHFLLLMNWLADAGYEHYEISNFSKPGWRSRHNSSYWKGKKYLGIGPSAHSFNGKERQWNVANNNVYIQQIEAGTLSFEKETLTPTQQLNEYLMIGLRTMEGINLAHTSALFKIKNEVLLDKAALHIKTGHIVFNNNCLQLTREGKFLADGIAADLFF